MESGGCRTGLIHPFQNGPHGCRRAQHPFPIVAITGRVRRRPPQLIERRIHGFQLDAHHGGQIGVHTNVLFKGGKEAGKGNAQGVKAGNKFVALENALRIRQPVVRRSDWRQFRNKLDVCAHLRRARRVTHHSRKLAEDWLSLRGRWLRSKRRKASGQHQGPQDSESPLFHVTYLPGAALAAVLSCGAAFTVKSAVREMV